ncbi:MAG TPA: hypothetical protein VK423_01380 [Thermoplasmata archaeon]|nr:hypothetical protein [Thermoplasmata archaeon]
MSPEIARPRPPEEEENCLVPGCGAVAARRLSLTEARKAFSGLPDRGRRAPLCRDHYREWKKATKKARTLERATW